MRRKVLYILFLLTSFGLKAQTPDKFTYQMVVRDVGNSILGNTTLGLKVSILQGSEAGTAVYSETHSPTTSNTGLISVGVGTGTTTDNFTAIDWSQGPYFLKTEIDPGGSTSYSLTATQALQSVPYALQSKTTANLPLPDGQVFAGNGSGQAAPVTLSGDATMDNAGVISIGAEKITSTKVTDNSLTADDLGTGSVTSDEITDGTISNADLNKATIPLSGFGDPTATLDFGNQVISNLREPVADQEVATKSYVDVLQDQINAIAEATGIVFDIDGNTYNSVAIGTQTWMMENMKTTRYNDGSQIAYPGSDDLAWQNNLTGAYAWGDNDQATNGDIYGALYNWYALDVASNGGKNVCPIGWHVPSDAEWTTMENYLIANGYNYDGTTTGNKIAKSMAAESGWPASAGVGEVGNTDFPTFRNKSEYTALPGGTRNNDGSFSYVGERGVWWTGSESSVSNGWYRVMLYNAVNVYQYDDTKKNGFSVRCLKD